MCQAISTALWNSTSCTSFCPWLNLLCLNSLVIVHQGLLFPTGPSSHTRLYLHIWLLERLWHPSSGALPNLLPSIKAEIKVQTLNCTHRLRSARHLHPVWDPGSPTWNCHANPLPTFCPLLLTLSRYSRWEVRGSDETMQNRSGVQI